MGKIERGYRYFIKDDTKDRMKHVFQIDLMIWVVAGLFFSCASNPSIADRAEDVAASAPPCRMEKLFHCPPGLDQCIEIPLTIPDDYTGNRDAELVRVSHCPPGHTMCYQIELASEKKRHPSDKASRRLQRLLHCPPASDDCVEIPLSDAPSETAAKPELMRLFHCPPSSEECYEVELEPDCQ